MKARIPSAARDVHCYISSIYNVGTQQMLNERMLAIIAYSDFTQGFRTDSASLKDWIRRLSIYLHKGYRISWKEITLQIHSPWEKPARDSQEEPQDSSESACILTLKFPDSRMVPVLSTPSWRFGFLSGMKRFPLACTILEVCRWWSLLVSFLVIFFISPSFLKGNLLD